MRYRYTAEFLRKTKREDFPSHNPPIDSDDLDVLRTAWYDALNVEFVREMEAKGHPIAILTIERDVSLHSYYWRDAKNTPWGTHQLTYTGTVVFETDKPVEESPFPWMAILDKLLLFVAGIIALYFIKQIVEKWVVSVLTETYKVTTKKYDEEGNLIEETTEEGTKPSLGGIGTLGIIVIIMIVVVMLLLGFRGKR